MKPIKLYESGHSDGYKGHPDGNFFLDKTTAAAFAHQKYGQGYGDVDEHFALEAPNGKFYLLKSDNQVALYSVEEARKSIKSAALKKLTKEEIKELGLE